jgi:hypothetical protein
MLRRGNPRRVITDPLLCYLTLSFRQVRIWKHSRSQFSAPRRADLSCQTAQSCFRLLPMLFGVSATTEKMRLRN